MTKNYSRITIADRRLIEQHLKAGKTISWIASALNKNKSSISREIRKGSSSGGYLSKDAQITTDRLKERNRRKAKIQGALETLLLLFLIEQQWSPEQISGRLRRLYSEISELQVSAETIYKYVYKSELREEITSCLRRGRKRRRKKQAPKRGGIRNKVGISMRPDISDRQEFGHWEGDLIVGQENQSAVLTLVERSSRYVRIVPLAAKDSRTVVTAIITTLRKVPKHLRKSLTYDQGSEMADHARITETLDLPVFFADAGKPQQRGTNENTNGLIRQYLPKGTDLRQFSDGWIAEAQHRLNNRPKPVLDFATPQEIFRLAELSPTLTLIKALAT